MALNRTQAIRLARALRELRESTRPDHAPTQAQLAAAFSAEGSRVASATLSSWESTTNPKTPPDVLATMYRHLGVDTEAQYLNNGHPVPVLPGGKAIEELS